MLKKCKHVSSDPMSAWENLRKEKMTTGCEVNVFQMNSGLRLSEKNINSDERWA